MKIESRSKIYCTVPPSDRRIYKNIHAHKYFFNNHKSHSAYSQKNYFVCAIEGKIKKDGQKNDASTKEYFLENNADEMSIEKLKIVSCFWHECEMMQ